MIEFYTLLMIKGALITIIIWLLASIISLSLGTIAGALLSKPLKKKIMTMLEGLLFFIRAVPLYVQLLLGYFLYPYLFGFSIPAIIIGTFTLGCCSAAYTSEIVRASLNALTYEQWQAAQILGYTPRQTMQRIFLPQAISASLPALMGEIEQLLKSTSLLGTIGVCEITHIGGNIIARELNPVRIYLIISLTYMGLSLLLNFFKKYIEMRKEKS